MKVRLLILPVIIISIFGCQSRSNQSNSKMTESKTENVTTKKNEPADNSNKIENSAPVSDKSKSSDVSACHHLKRDDLELDKKQTFAIDFKPFEKSCFVTFHDPEFDNPPLGSQFFIYQNGKEVFNFPEQFGGGNTTCWVNSVTFEDLNNDQLKDVIVVGKCGEKGGSYNENMVYLNNGRDFVTHANSNAETMDFNNSSQIRDFVKKNPTLFSK
jgi:hypothetical protein